VAHAKIDYLRNSLLNNPGISNISFSYASPSSNDNWTSSFLFNHATKPTDFSANLKWADADYFKTYRMKLIAGHFYHPSDTIREIVVNESLVKKLSIKNPKDILGKEVRFGDKGQGIPVVGVVRDFNANSLKEPMAPVLLSSWKDVYQVANIKMKPGAEKSTLAFVEKLWSKTFPDNVFQYHFLDETIAGFYKQENELSLLYVIFAGIAIFVSGLGLYGLISFMTAQRTKEIGVRKVLGAPVRNIVYLLSKEFTVLIIISFAIAAPVGYYFMQQWLQQYTYRVQLGIPIFLLAAAGSVLVAWITVGHRTIKAAIANPVKSLRTE
jgi:ABC-type antimicrobial peptide transport system permease subunit